MYLNWITDSTYVCLSYSNSFQFNSLTTHYVQGLYKALDATEMLRQFGEEVKYSYKSIW